jgi:hypothetical protein
MNRARTWSWRASSKSSLNEVLPDAVIKHKEIVDGRKSATGGKVHSQEVSLGSVENGVSVVPEELLLGHQVRDQIVDRVQFGEDHINPETWFTSDCPSPPPFGCACANSGTQYAATATARKPNVEPGIAFTIVFRDRCLTGAL